MRPPEFLAIWPNQSAAFRERRFNCPVQFQTYLVSVRRRAEASGERLAFTWLGPSVVEIRGVA